MFKRLFTIALALSLLTGALSFVPSVSAAADKELKEVSSPSQCGGQLFKGTGLPVNCIFLEEPIGGKPGYDLYVVQCFGKDKKAAGMDAHCDYELWRGDRIGPEKSGPLQAILSYKPGDELHGSFGLLYSYVSLVYKYLSGAIIGIVVLMTVVGGVQITVSGGDPGKRDAGKDRIVHALMGMALWFLASLILYTINPTFFRF